MAYTLGQYKRDVASGKIQNPEVWTYKKVIDWQARTRTGRTKARTSTLAGRANEMTNQILSGAISGLAGMKPGVTAEANRLAGQEFQAAKGFAEALRPYANDIQNIYTTAGNALSGAAQGFSDEVGGLLDSDTNANNQTLARLGLDPATTPKGGLVGDVMYGLQYPAARGFITSGRDYAAAAAMAPRTTLLQAQQFAAQRRAAGQDQLAKIDEEIAKIQGQRPEVYANTYDTLFNRDLKSKEFAQQKANDAWQKYVDQQKLVMEGEAMQATLKKLGLDEQAQAYDQWLSTERLKLEQMRAQASVMNAGPDPKQIKGSDGSYWQYDPSTGQMTQIAPPGTLGPKAGGKDGVKPPTVGQTQKWLEDAADLARTFYFGTVLNEDGKRVLARDVPGFDPSNADAYGQDALGYQEAFKRMKTRFPKLGNRQILATLNELYDTPGSDGRPWFDMFERAKLKKAGFSQAQIRKAMRPEYRGSALGNRMLAALGRPSLTAASPTAAADEQPKITADFAEVEKLKKAGYTDEQIVQILTGKGAYVPAAGPGVG